MPFQRVASVADIPVGQGLFVEINGTGVAVFNAGGGRVYACGAVCPHEDGPLAEGWLEGDVAVCPWHGFDFELDSGRCRVDPELSVPVFPARIHGDVVEVDLP
jgi:nitrite reductase/ring-hydroxylating ferredoxin subunit